MEAYLETSPMILTEEQRTLSRRACFYSQPTRLLLFSLSCVLFQPLDGVLRAVDRLIGGVTKFGHIGECMRDTLHLLPVRQCILDRVSTIACRCILGVAPVYLSKVFVLSSSCPGRRSLRLASRGNYLIPCSYVATKRNRAFSAAGPS